MTERLAARVAINAMPLLLPRTGIGQYAWHLIREMQVLLDPVPQLFYGGDWDTAMRSPPPPEPPGALQRLKQKVPFGYEAARFLQQRAFDRRVAHHRFDLYHEPNYLAQRFAGPTVVTVHDLSWIRHPETHPPERVRAMDSTMPRVVREATRIVTDSEFTRREVISHYGVAPERVRTVLLGADEAFLPVGPAEAARVLVPYDLQPDGYVLAVGTLEPRKNIAAVIAAHGALPPALRRRYPLVVAGMRGWGDQRLPPGAQASIDAGELRLAGFVPQAELPAFYSGAAAFVYPSIYEGFGLPPLEAMACAAPVIVSNRASLPEVVGEAGFLVEPHDIDAWTRRLREVLEDEGMRQVMRDRALARSRHFGWRRCALETLGVYRAALAA